MVERLEVVLEDNSMYKYALGWKQKEKFNWLLAILSATIIWSVIIVLGQLVLHYQTGCYPLLVKICQ